MRKSILIKAHLHIQRCRKALSDSSPSWKSLSTKLSNKQILMCIQKYTYPKFITFPHNLSNHFNICVVIDSLLRFKAFPCNMKAYNIHSPMLKIKKVLINETMIGRELDQIGMKRLQLVDNINSVIDSISSKLVYEQRVICIYFY